jgi:hypothetical protein
MQAAAKAGAPGDVAGAVPAARSASNASNARLEGVPIEVRKDNTNCKQCKAAGACGVVMKQGMQGPQAMQDDIEVGEVCTVPAAR